KTGKQNGTYRKVWSLAEDRHGNLWVGAQGSLYRSKPGTEVFQPFFAGENGDNDDIFIDLKIDQQGNLWAGTLKNGLYFIEHSDLADSSGNNKFLNFKHEPGNRNSLSNNTAEAVFASKNGKIWVGTDGGLNRLDPANDNGTFRRYLLEDGLRDEKIMAIVEDDSARIWISTAGHGISCLDTGGFFRHFGKKDGLITNDFLLSSGYKDNLGRLYFGGEEGLQIFHPDSLPASQRPAAPLYFTDFRAAGRSGEKLQLLVLDSSIHFVKNVVVPPGYANLTFRFAALDFFQPENIRYAYRLGLKEEWQDLGYSREISLLQLPPGTYLLQIKAVHNESFSEGKTISLRLRIKPAFHQSLAAKVIALLLLAAAVIWLYQYRVRRKLAAAETRRLRELDQVKTRLYTNITHEFRTPLTIILGEAEQGRMEIEKTRPENSVLEDKPISNFPISQFLISNFTSIRRQGQQLLNLVNQMLDLAKLESGNLHLKMAQGDVVGFLKYLLESFSSVADAKKIAFRFDSPVEHFVMDYDEERLRQIVSNLLSNAIKFTPEGGEVALRINHGDFQNHHDLEKHLHLTVSDTGIGIPPEKLPRIFDRFYQVDDSATRHAEGTGIGLTLTRELV
ncbi:MAG: ATP-binding protein, partial [Bacteroidota bacterium]